MYIELFNIVITLFNNNLNNKSNNFEMFKFVNILQLSYGYFNIQLYAFLNLSFKKIDFTALEEPYFTQVFFLITPDFLVRSF